MKGEPKLGGKTQQMGRESAREQKMEREIELGRRKCQC
jgi:hypothetical protein